MPERRITIQNKLGLHARASAKFVAEASRFESDLALLKDEIEINAKSIMGLMMLAASKGSTLVLKAEGKDADKALDTLEELINQRFGEDE